MLRSGAAITSRTQTCGAGVGASPPPEWGESRFAGGREAPTPLALNGGTIAWRFVDLDGLLLHVQLLDGFGTLVPVDGVIDVPLATETKLAKGGRSNFRDGNSR